MTSQERKEMSDISNSVKDYGAKGDGITDDTGAFRRALMQEGEVTVPDGMYVITGELPVSRLCQGISSDRCGGIILARHPEWGYDFARYFRSTIIVPTKFYIKHLTIIGVVPATHSGSSKGGIYVKSHDPHVLFTIYGNHFMTNDWWAKSTGEKE